MTKEDIEKQLSEFFNALKSKKGIEKQLCEQFSMGKMVDRTSSKFGKRNTNNPENHWDAINLKTYEIDKPLLICLSGNGTETLKEANGFCKQVERMLELIFKNKIESSNPEDYIDIIGCAYGKDNRYLYYPTDSQFKELYSTPAEYIKDFPQALKPSYKNHDFGQSEADLLVNRLLLPRCLDSNNGRLSVEECCNNMSQVTFFTYCYGSEALNTIIDSLNKKLLIYGFTKEEVDSILTSMMSISFALKNYTRKIPTINFYASTDYTTGKMVKLVDYMQKYKLNLITRHCKSGDKAIGQELYPASFVESVDAESLEFAFWGTETDIDGGSDQDIDHSVANLARDENWDAVYKEKGIYNAISQMMSWALCRAVENGLQNVKADKYIPKMSMKVLQEELMSIYKSFTQEDLMTRK